jgi:DNA repair protein RecO (recombination protein O)
MKLEKFRAIVLQSTPFQEKSKIIKIFSKEMGIISVIVKNISQKNSFLNVITSVFSEIEIICKKTNSDLFIYKEASLINDFLFLRDNLLNLTSACDMAKAILKTQFFQKSAEPLYDLFISYLKKVKDFENPKILSNSFCLKVLIFEKMLFPSLNCNSCKEAEATHIFNGESFCKNHAPKYSFSFTKEEFLKIMILLSSKKFSELQQIELSEKLSSNLSHLFSDFF